MSTPDTREGVHDVHVRPSIPPGHIREFGPRGTVRDAGRPPSPTQATYATVCELRDRLDTVEHLLGLIAERLGIEDPPSD